MTRLEIAIQLMVHCGHPLKADFQDFLDRADQLIAADQYRNEDRLSLPLEDVLSRLSEEQKLQLAERLCQGTPKKVVARRWGFGAMKEKKT